MNARLLAVAGSAILLVCLLSLGLTALVGCRTAAPSSSLSPDSYRLEQAHPLELPADSTFAYQPATRI